MRRRLCVLAAVAVGVLTVAVLPVAAAPDPAPARRLELPAPTGTHPVGQDTLHLRDEGRADPWVPERDRELMVTVWYPALEAGGRPARYVTPEESRRILLSGNLTDVPQDLLSTTRTQADDSWDLSWQRLVDWKRWLAVAGTEHSTFTDYSPLREQIDGVGLPDEPIEGMRAVDLTRDYVAAFLDHHLRGSSGRLFDGPSAAYPEVRFWM